jgi:hypothetical protein
VTTRTDRRWATAVFFAVLLTLGAAARTQGNTRDEGYYFDAAELYSGWYAELWDNLGRGAPQRSFTRSSVDRWFSYNHEHPALMKTLFGLSWRALHRCACPSQGGRHPIGYVRRHHTLGLLSEEAALRLPTHLVVALMAMLVFLFGASVWSTGAGLTAASALGRGAEALLRRATGGVRRADCGDVGGDGLRLPPLADRASLGL